ncbi:DUF7619 domain-containing protein [Tenacibaculum salmonis]|uniref:DUF7619 domain-containing protein n=1 Tax=Tenacibaculum sp. P3-BQ1 TaxID=3232310 RepID=UPI0034E0553B
MKKLLLLTLLIAYFAIGNAQKIDFPDPLFENALLNHIPKIDTDNNSEISIQEAENVTYLNLDNKWINNLSGIENFVNLVTLQANKNQLTSIDITKNVELRSINLNWSKLTSIDVTKNIKLSSISLARNYKISNIDLTNNLDLTSINLDFNQLTSIDFTKNIKLRSISLSFNQLTSIDFTKNVNLLTIELSRNKISNIDLTNNLDLISLNVSGNNIEGIDVSKNILLTDLDVGYNDLGQLDVTKNVLLQKLQVRGNILTGIDVSKNVNLVWLYVPFNNLLDLDISKNVLLQGLSAENNKLTDINLSNNSKLKSLRIYRNNLNTLDVSSCSLTLLYFSYNPNLKTVSMIGQQIEYGTSASSGKKLDLVGCPNLEFICADQEYLNDIFSLLEEANQTSCMLSNNCDVPHNRIQGTVTYDVNGDGCDSADIPFTGGLKVTAISQTTGESAVVYPNKEGEYNLFIADDTYSITPALQNLNYFTFSTPVITNPINIPEDLNTLITDYCVKSIGNFNDLEVSIVPLTRARPGFNATYKLIYKNIGTTTQSGIVTLDYQENVLNYVSSIPTVNSNTNGQLTWSFTNLLPLQSVEIPVTFILNTPLDSPALNNGDILNYTARVTGATDETPDNNVMTLSQIVVNSYDPNDKRCLEGNILNPNDVGNYLHYLIRFENKGTAEAVNIRVKDVIDTTKLDIESLIPLESSHSYSTTITKGNEVEFIFNDINLPFDDANNDGYVLFKIKSKATLVEGDKIVNGAAIYFDFNAPVITADETVNVTINSDDITWTGTTNNDWNTTSNWSTNSLPTASSRIVIPSGLTNYPTANSAVTFTRLTIESGASFIPKSTVTGSVTYKRNIPNTNWHLVSSPLSEETYENLIANNTFVTGSGSNIGIGEYSNDIGSAWSYAQSSKTGLLPSGNGLSVKLATAGTLSFTGTINTSDVNSSITAGTRNNLNLVGNPFTAYINSADFATENTEALSEQTVWLWNGTAYETHNEINPIEIAPGQSFFVKAATNGNVTFAISNQSHQNDTFMRQAPKPSFELFVENEASKKSTKVFYIANKTTGFDKGYDSKIFEEGKKANFEIFTELLADNKGNKLAIQSLPNTDLEAMIVPVGITAKSVKEVTFSVKTQNLPEDIKIYLEDRIANTFTNISEKNHKVILENTTKGAGQFYIHTTSKILEEAPIQQKLQNVSIFKSVNNSITITGLQTDNASLNIYSILGAKIISTSFKSTGVSVIQLPKTSIGVYIVELKSDLGTINKKIILE